MSLTARDADRRRLGWALGITLAYLLVEVAGGVLSRSLALLADAVHMGSDAAALALSLFALWYAARPATAERTFGFHRTEILAALANGAALLAIAAIILYEAYRRVLAPPAVRGGLMLLVAAVGLAVNLGAMLILRTGDPHNLNLRGAFLHILSDLLGSIATIAASVIILTTGWRLADPLISGLIGLLIIAAGWRLMRESVNVLLEGTPAGVDYHAIHTALAGVPGIVDVHDLHIWAITSGFPVLTSHVVLGPEVEQAIAVREVQRVLTHQFGISHATIQVESAHGGAAWICEGNICYPAHKPA